MSFKRYLRLLAKQISVSDKLDEIVKEYSDHMEDHMEALMEKGMSAEEAEKEAVYQLGDPVYAGRKLNKVYRKGVEWPLLTYFLIVSAAFVILRYFLPFRILPQEWADYIGLGTLLLGLLISALEKYEDLPLFYAWARDWNGGGITNNAFILAVSVYFFARNIKSALIWILLILVLLTLERYSIACIRDKKVRELLWEVGIAETDINSYKGYGFVNGKRVRLEAKEGIVKRGNIFIVVELHGFRPLVMSL
ncbi:hypothetical protein M2145_002514 [Lachnospiraceae bacterium PF1-21]|uniref:permease prefix domain 1-containing protein n=1 Tax=Ohessyouella blattaphilus TaxID=2949333 RepID=UPI003E214EA8